MSGFANQVTYVLVIIITRAIYSTTIHTYVHIIYYSAEFIVLSKSCEQRLITKEDVAMHTIFYTPVF